jgi:hypothetical protein
MVCPFMPPITHSPRPGNKVPRTLFHAEVVHSTVQSSLATSCGTVRKTNNPGAMLLLEDHGKPSTFPSGFCTGIILALDLPRRRLNATMAITVSFDTRLD